MISTREHILITDDEEALRLTLKRKLTSEGYSCEEAADAEQASDRLRNAPAGLVILDVSMPGKPGNKFLPEIKAKFPETAVIMMSADNQVNIIVQCLKDGADDYIYKPVRMEEVSYSVRHTLEKRQLESCIKKYLKYSEQKNGTPTTTVRKFFLDGIQALVSELEANDKYTAGHSRRVTDIALALGEKLNLSPDELDDLRWGALLHDVGKIAVNQDILNKPGKLTEDEYRHIMSHAIIGPDIVRPVVNERVVDIISHHHDRYDGSGFNQAIAGKDIPLGARILAIADAYDAMVSDRPYRLAMSCDNALTEIRNCRGSHFDPVVASVFSSMVAEEKVPV